MCKYANYDKLWGRYAIRKTINGKRMTFGTYASMDEACRVIEKLIECDWDKSKLDEIKKELNIPITRRINL